MGGSQPNLKSNASTDLYSYKSRLKAVRHDGGFRKNRKEEPQNAPTQLQIKRKKLSCPQCGSKHLYKDGLRYLANDKAVQRWLCRNCGYRFTDPNHKRNSQWKNLPFSLNLPNCLDHNCQGNDEPLRGDSTALAAVQTLAAVEKEIEKRAAGATLEANAKSEIINFAWWLKRQGYAEATMKSRVRRLRLLVKLGADLNNPESVKETIAKQMNWSLGYKELMAEAYGSFLTMLGRSWEPPRYKRVPKLPFIPLESELDQLIGCFNTKMAALLQLLKETGMRLGEAVNLKWSDIDFEVGTVRVTPEKGSNPRIFRLSGKLLAMLRKLFAESKGFRVFPSKSCVEAYFYRKRKQIAARLCNPRLLRISFHTFRHWKATMEYAKTKDILYVMKLLGHRNIQNTLVYTQLVDFKTEEYTCKAVTTSEEASMLIEEGFEYVCTTPEGVMLFRKRK